MILWYYFALIIQSLRGTTAATTLGNNVSNSHCFIPLPFYSSPHGMRDNHFYYHSLQCIYAGLIHYTDVVLSCTSQQNESENDDFSLQNSAQDIVDGLRVQGTTIESDTLPNLCCFRHEGSAAALEFVVHRAAAESPFFGMIQDVVPISERVFLDDADMLSSPGWKSMIPAHTSSTACTFHVDDTILQKAARYLKSYFHIQNISLRRYYFDVQPKCRIRDILPPSSILVVHEFHLHSACLFEWILNFV